MAGGDMMLYQQIMEQKMMLRQQQMFMKQQQLLMKQQKSGKKGTQPGAGLNAAQAAGFGNNLQPGVTPTYRRKSRASWHDSGRDVKVGREARLGQNVRRRQEAWHRESGYHQGRRRCLPRALRPRNRESGP